MAIRTFANNAFAKGSGFTAKSTLIASENTIETVAVEKAFPLIQKSKKTRRKK